MISLTDEDLIKLSQDPVEVLPRAIFKIGDFGLAKRLAKAEKLMTDTYAGSELTMGLFYIH